MNGLLDTEIAHVLTVADNSKTRGHSMKLIKYHCSIDATLLLTVFTQRNFVADFLQAKCNFGRKTAVLRFWAPFGA